MMAMNATRKRFKIKASRRFGPVAPRTMRPARRHARACFSVAQQASGSLKTTKSGRFQEALVAARRQSGTPDDGHRGVSGPMPEIPPSYRLN
jgi:hypothetical protein